MKCLEVKKKKAQAMDATDSYQSSTTDFADSSTFTEASDSPEATTLVSRITESLMDSTTDFIPTGGSIFQSELRFSVVDYSVFGIMLAMSGEINCHH